MPKSGSAFIEPLAQHGERHGQASVEPVNALAELLLLEDKKRSKADDDGNEPREQDTVERVLRLRLAGERKTHFAPLKPNRS
ncbi:MAG: hypothetical protein F4053_00600 [Proteobacteria bacterium]|nr:hypothetical protein [Pseudomonadota bacterium]MYJ94134.1 hypothetical protein [Pseudomonadota bacterium]